MKFPLLPLNKKSMWNSGKIALLELVLLPTLSNVILLASVIWCKFTPNCYLSLPNWNSSCTYIHVYIYTQSLVMNVLEKNTCADGYISISLPPFSIQICTLCQLLFSPWYLVHGKCKAQALIIIIKTPNPIIIIIMEPILHDGSNNWFWNPASVKVLFVLWACTQC